MKSYFDVMEEYKNELANNINDFMYDSNYYDYNDNYSDKTEGLNEILDDINNNPRYLVNTLKNNILNKYSDDISESDKTKINGFIDRLEHVLDFEAENISKIEEYMKLLTPIIINNNLLSNFDLKPTDSESIVNDLISYYINDKDVFLGVVLDLHNADNYKEKSIVRRALLTKIQNALNNLKNNKRYLVIEMYEDNNYRSVGNFSNYNEAKKYAVNRQDEADNGKRFSCGLESIQVKDSETDKLLYDTRKGELNSEKQTLHINKEKENLTMGNENNTQKKEYEQGLINVWIPIKKSLEKSKNGDIMIPIHLPKPVIVKTQINDGVGAESPKYQEVNVNSGIIFFKGKEDFVKEVDKEGNKLALITGTPSFTVNISQPKMVKEGNNWKEVKDENGNQQYNNFKVALGSLMHGIKNAVEQAKGQEQGQAV